MTTQLEDKTPLQGGMHTGVAIMGFLLCFVAGAGVMWGYSRHAQGATARSGSMTQAEGVRAQAPGATWTDEAGAIPVSSKDPVWGDRDAPATVVLFSDFQCPFCSRIEPTLDKVKETYGKEKVRVVWKNFPLNFHANAKPAAEAAQGVFALEGSEAFFRFHNLALKNQRELGAEAYEKWAREAGVRDMSAWKKGVETHAWAEKVEQDVALGGRLPVSGTPSLFVNGIPVSPPSPDVLTRMIDQEIAEAQAKLQAGVAKDKLYVTLSNENRASAKAAPPPAPAASLPPLERKNIPVDPKSPSLGSADAKVVVQEFSDFECPACSKAEPILRELRDIYKDKVRFVWRDMPLAMHPEAPVAAEAAREALAEKGTLGFWAMHDKLFASQKDLSRAKIEALGHELGLDAAKLKAALDSGRHQPVIEADAKIAEAAGIRATPGFVINGYFVSGAQPVATFRAVIDRALAEAR